MQNVSIKSGRDYGIIQKKDRFGKLIWYARVVRTEPDGTKKQYTQRADSKSHARRLRDELAGKHKTGGQRAVEGDRITFREFAADYKARKLVPAKYHHGQKTSGLRSYRTARNFLENLLSHFGNQRLRDITPAAIEHYKQRRLDAPIITLRKDGTKSERPRAIASVNRELALLRAMLNDAVLNGLIIRSPFVNSKLVSLSDETRRERVLTFAEETRLLAACSDTLLQEYERGGKKITAEHKSNRQHLQPLIVVALDTAMRSGELLKLEWKDVDFTGRAIRIVAFNTKTARARTVGMTQRVFHELTRLWEQSPKEQSGLVFGIKTSVKRAFASACKDAGIEDFRFHDCRHTAITRLVQTGIPPMEIMKISGHTQMNTFARYVNPDASAVNRIADALTVFHAGAFSGIGAEDSREFVN